MLTGLTLLSLGLSGCMSAGVQRVPSSLPPLAEKMTQVAPSLEFKAEIYPKEIEPGSVALIKVRLGPDSRGIRTIQGDFEGISLPFFSVTEEGETYFETILSVPYERKPGPAKVSLLYETLDRPNLADAAVLPKVIQLSKYEHSLPFTVKEGHYISEVLHVDPTKVRPTKKNILKRVIEEKNEVGQIYKQLTLQKYWDGSFGFPIENTRITSPFGTRRVYNGLQKSFHTGVDLKAKVSTPVYTAAAGKVLLAKDLFFTGNTVIVDHGYGVMTLYAHLSKLKVKKNQMVKSRTLLGLSGKTGRVSGPHLHWMAIVHRVRVNPIALTEVIK